jgi:hypothetical protein
LLASSAHAALEVSLHEVNTSIGLKPTSATNEWKLETDPVVPDAPTTDDTLGGELNNTYDPSQFQLAIDPSTGTYALGWSVENIDPFQVTSFQVYDTNGGFYTVSATSNPNVDSVIPSAPEPDSPYNGPAPNGIEAGIVDDITFSLQPGLKNEALPATIDQNFFELNLVPLNDNPNIVPLDYSASGGPGSYLEIGDPEGDTPTFLTFPATTFDTSYVPEPTVLGILSLGVAGLAARRRR